MGGRSGDDDPIVVIGSPREGAAGNAALMRFIAGFQNAYLMLANAQGGEVLNFDNAIFSDLFSFSPLDQAPDYEYVSSIGESTELVCEQASGDLYARQPDGTLKLVARGYSGQEGEARNNPAYENIRSVGPIPVGTYAISRLHNSDETGPVTVSLSPSGSNQTYDRNAFAIHGNNSRNDASQGCIIVPIQTRNEIASLGSVTLHVVPVIPGVPRG